MGGQVVNQSAHLSQAAAPLWVSDVTSALPSLDPGGDAVDDGAPASLLDLGANFPYRMLEAITDQRLFGSAMLLIDPLP